MSVRVETGEITMTVFSSVNQLLLLPIILRARMKMRAKTYCYDKKCAVQILTMCQEISMVGNSVPM